MFLMIEAAILKGVALQSIGEREQAISSMMDALNMAEPEGFMRTFIDLGDKVKDLLEITRNEAENAAMLDYIDNLLEAFKPLDIERQSVSSIPPKRAGEKLSEREQDVLRLLPSSLSSTDMAAELSISVNTLRTHLKNIYAKLNAHSRYEAIERAKEIGLL
jgi:LuxR family maltose regulon positive regulatory protein